MERPILEIKNLQTYFYVDGKVLRAVDGLSYSVGRGECVAVVGESASGKSVSALSVLQLVADPPGRIVGGRSCWMELICSSCLSGKCGPFVGIELPWYFRSRGQRSIPY